MLLIEKRISTPNGKRRNLSGTLLLLHQHSALVFSDTVSSIIDSLILIPFIGLQLDPIVYARSVQNPLTGLAAVNSNAKVKALLNERNDCGFPGIPKFQCVAIRGCCWDESVYNPAYKIPQCYKPIELVPDSVFKIVAPPAELMPVAGECNTNFFRVPQLYYEREACNYDFDMFKYGGIEGNKTPLDPPTLNDCIFKLGCCWEDDEEIVRKYE
jgi:hypothetical protein